MLHLLSFKLLVDAYEKALELKLDEEFLFFLEREISSRVVKNEMEEEINNYTERKRNQMCHFAALIKLIVKVLQ